MVDININEKKISLADVSVGESAVVKSVAQTSEIKGRLEDMGVINGTIIKCLYRSPLGDPVAYKIKGAVIGLRKKDSMHIEVVSVAGGECESCGSEK